MLVIFTRPGGAQLHVNLAAVAAVESVPDRPNKALLHVGGSSIPVLGTPEETLRRLGWSEPAALGSNPPADFPSPGELNLDDGL